MKLDRLDGRLLAILVLVLGMNLFARIPDAQMVQQIVANFPAPSGLSLNPGWTLGQDLYIPCTPSGNTCTVSEAYYPLPMTSGSPRILSVYCGNGSSAQSSVYISSASINGVALTTSSAYVAYSTGTDEVGVAIAYGIGTGGTSSGVSVSVTMSGTCVGWSSIFLTELPIESGYVASLDFVTAGTPSTSCSTACAGVAVTTTATDIVWQMAYYDNSEAWNSWSGSGYITDTSPNPNAILINSPVGSIPAPTYNQGTSGAFVPIAVGFKSTANTFTGPTVNESMVHFDCASGAPCQGTNTGSSCTPTCTLTIDSTGTNGSSDAGLFVWALTSGSTFTTSLSSISVGGSSLTVLTPSSVADSGGTYVRTGWAYITSLPSNATSLSATMSANATIDWAWYHFHKATGTWSFDTSGTSTPSASYTPQGPSLTLSGTSEVVCHAIVGNGGFGGMTVATQPGGPDSGSWANGTAFGGCVLNSQNGNGPYYVYQNDEASAAAAVALK